MNNNFFKILSIFLLFSQFVLPLNIFAADLSVPNNKYGIHLAQPSDEDMKKAADLVNSNGGKWGYVTLVIQENDRDKNKWEGIFDKLRELKLIPIIRIATQPEGSNWKRPKEQDAEEWAKFLNSLSWVVKNRYVILFNEPNHSTEWGGAVDAESFGRVNEAFARKLKETNPDFFVMMGGLDASPPSQPPRYEEAEKYMRAAVSTIGTEDFNKYFDGLSSHSYPNPGFIGSPIGSGKGTVRTYIWELDILKSMGVKDLPVFITETGWHGNAMSRDQVASNFKIAYQTIWLPDDRVIAVTPFVLNYQGEPFLQFSWLKKDSNEPYPEYDMVKSLMKPAGRPEFDEKGNFITKLPKEIVAESTFHFKFTLENKGQAVWTKEDGYTIELAEVPKTSYLVSDVGKVKPREDQTFEIFFQTSTEIGKKVSNIVLMRDDKKILQSLPWNFEVIPLPPLDFKASLFPKVMTNGSDFEIQVFDEDEELVYKESDVVVEKGKARLEKIENIALDTKYRVVLLKKYYLPAQTFVKFKKGENEIKFKNMYPFDLNGDGAWSWSDIGAFFTNTQMWGLWWPWS